MSTKVGTDQIYDVLLELKEKVGGLTTEVSNHNKKLDKIEDKVGCIDKKVASLVEWKDCVSRRTYFIVGCVATIISVVVGVVLDKVL